MYFSTQKMRLYCSSSDSLSNGPSFGHMGVYGAESGILCFVEKPSVLSKYFWASDDEDYAGVFGHSSAH